MMVKKKRNLWIVRGHGPLTLQAKGGDGSSKGSHRSRTKSSRRKKRNGGGLKTENESIITDGGNPAIKAKVTPLRPQKSMGNAFK